MNHVPHPLAKPDFVEEVKQKMQSNRDKIEWELHLRNREYYYRTSLGKLAGALYPSRAMESALRTDLSRALTSLGWLRTSVSGRLCYIKPKQEVIDNGF